MVDPDKTLVTPMVDPEAMALVELLMYKDSQEVMQILNLEKEKVEILLLVLEQGVEEEMMDQGLAVKIFLHTAMEVVAHHNKLAPKV